MAAHVVQSPEWGEFKSKYGTKAVRVGCVQYTIHKIPFISQNIAYCPKVNPSEVNWELLKNSLVQNHCAFINFDVPNVIANSKEADEAKKVLEKHCVKSPKDTFARFNIILDITKSEEELLSLLHKKHRYNLKYAQRHGVFVRNGLFEEFYSLLKNTAKRQKYYIHPEKYYKDIWRILGKEKLCHILTAEYNNAPLASWMLFSYNNVLYYPYGGSSEENKNLFASTLIGWEAVKLGKKLGCHTFDMWGAAKDPQDEKDPWHGFTTFKLRFGGKHVEYIDSYDYVLNNSFYKFFNTAQNIRWKLLKILK